MLDERTPREPPGLLASAWRYRWMTLIIVFQVALLGFVSTTVFRSEPRATASMSLADPRSSAVLPVSGGATGDLERYTANRAAFVRSSRVLTAASRLLAGRYEPDELVTMVDTSVDSTADVIRVSATGPTEENAAAIANAVTTAYSEVSAEDTKAAADAALRVIDAQAREVRRALAAAPSNDPRSTAAAQTLSALEVRSNEVSTYATLFGSGVIFIDPARAEADSSGGDFSVRNMVLGGLVGFLISLAIAWIRADRNQRIEDPEDAADLLGVPLFGDIPDLGDRQNRPRLTELASMPAEPYQFAINGLRFGLGTGIVLVVSADRHEGRTTTAANVAAGAAREGMRVALVDGDSRNQGLSRLIGVDPGQAGLTDVLSGRNDLERCLIPQRVGDDTQLWALPAGRFHDGVPSDFRSRQMADTLGTLRASHDLVVVDCPPLLRVPDASALAGHADGALAVVRSGSAVSRLEALRHQLDLLPVRLLGYVVTRPRQSRDAGLQLTPVVDVVDSTPSAR